MPRSGGDGPFVDLISDGVDSLHDDALLLGRLRPHSDLSGPGFKVLNNGAAVIRITQRGGDSKRVLAAQGLKALGTIVLDEGKELVDRFCMITWFSSSLDGSFSCSGNGFDIKAGNVKDLTLRAVLFVKDILKTIRRHTGEIDEDNFMATIIGAGGYQDFMQWEFKAAGVSTCSLLTS